jgi:hypothetical protein
MMHLLNLSLRNPRELSMLLQVAELSVNSLELVKQAANHLFLLLHALSVSGGVGMMNFHTRFS